MTVASAPRRGGHAADHRQLTLIAVLAVAVVSLAAIVGVLLARGGTTSGSGLQGSGLAASQARAVAAFDSLDLAGANNVTVVVGRPQSVVVRADNNLLSHVTTQVTDGTLVIGNSGSFSTRTPMSVDVRVPSLTALALTGSGQITVTGISTPQLTVSVVGSGLLTASGTATRLNVSLPGSGQAQLFQLAAEHVRAVLAGSGLIQVAPTASLDASVHGTGAIFYSGNPPQVTTSITGTGAVIHG
ncbi:head GIN domain-containing protein [Trebonia kvetii]|nr:head GIN domain-containing protein [Trebonia kvetii]